MASSIRSPIAGGLFLLSLLAVADAAHSEGASLQQDTARQQALVAEARGRAKAFAAELKETLQQSIAAGGLEAAVGKCHIAAPGIAQVHSGDNWHIGRTALRVRNPDNRADAWEKRVMQGFQQRLQQGESFDKLEVSQLSGGEFRYMKAIPTAALCVGCHGDNIAQSVSRRIDELYPNDAARGFRVGDMRGAFTIRLNLNQDRSPNQDRK